MVAPVAAPVAAWWDNSLGLLWTGRQTGRPGVTWHVGTSEVLQGKAFPACSAPLGDRHLPRVPALCCVPVHRAPAQPAEEHDGLHPVLQRHGPHLLHRVHVRGECRRPTAWPGPQLPSGDDGNVLESGEVVGIRVSLGGAHRPPGLGGVDGGRGESSSAGGVAGFPRDKAWMPPILQKDILCAVRDLGSWRQCFVTRGQVAF